MRHIEASQEASGVRTSMPYADIICGTRPFRILLVIHAWCWAKYLFEVRFGSRVPIQNQHSFHEGLVLGETSCGGTDEGVRGNQRFVMLVESELESCSEALNMRNEPFCTFHQRFCPRRRWWWSGRAVVTVVAVQIASYSCSSYKSTITCTWTKHV